MDKQKWVVISIGISIITVIYTIVVYYGYVRLWELHRKPCSHYLKTYGDLEKADASRVVVSFTTQTKRIPYLRPFLNSLLDQTVRVDDIALSIPYKDQTQVPEDIKEVVRIYPFSVNYQDAGSLVPALLREGEKDTKIILVKDDVIYGQDFIEEMINASNNNPDKIIYGSPDRDIKGGILIKPAFFDIRVTDYKQGETCNAWLEKCSDNNSIIVDYTDNHKN